MDFGGAIHCMLGGDKVHRQAWARDIFLWLQKPDDHSKMTKPYIYIQYADKSCVPWVPRHEDMLANDWAVAIV
jgi:hypothetical protein